MSRQKGSVRAEEEPGALLFFCFLSISLFSFRDGDYSDSWAEHERENGRMGEARERSFGRSTPAHHISQAYRNADATLVFG